MRVVHPPTPCFLRGKKKKKEKRLTGLAVGKKKLEEEAVGSF